MVDIIWPVVIVAIGAIIIMYIKTSDLVDFCMVTLCVSAAPHLTEEPRNVVITFGKTAYFHCEADGDPQPDIVWLQNR